MKKRQILLITGFVLLAFFIKAQNGKNVVISEELIFPAQELHCHSSSLLELPNGDLLSCWFQGTGERTCDDVKIMGARKKQGERKWSLPFVMADTEFLPDCNPVLFLNRKGKLFLVWIVVQANEWHSSILKYRTSCDFQKENAPVWEWQDNILLKPDNRFAETIEKAFSEIKTSGHGWSEYAPKYDEMILQAAKDPIKRSLGWMTRIKPMVMSGGRIILPLYSDGFNIGLMAISDNDGETWRPGLPLVGRGPIQPALALRKNGEILAVCRDSGDEPTRVWKSVSKDKGETWEPAVKIEIACEASVELQALTDGNFVMVVNDSDTGGRSKLSLYLSMDEGKKWDKKVILEKDISAKNSYSYPSLIETKDGLLHLTYSLNENGRKSIKHLVLDPQRIASK